MTAQEINKIANFSFKISLADFKNIFGNEIGDDLWWKFKKNYNNDFLTFFHSGLDPDNQAIVAALIV